MYSNDVKPRKFSLKISLLKPRSTKFFDKYENVISKELKELEDKNSFIVNIFNDIENDRKRPLNPIPILIRFRFPAVWQ